VLGIGPHKQRQVRRLATAWMAERRLGVNQRYSAIRFDAVGVTFDDAGRAVDVEHIEGAF
jgi:Holliday junction resolvase-like predicted endonuclease